MIGGDPVHAGTREPRAAEDIASAQDDGDLDAKPGDFLDLAGDAADHGGVDAVIGLSQQGLTGKLHQDPRKSRRPGIAHACTST